MKGSEYVSLTFEKWAIVSMQLVHVKTQLVGHTNLSLASMELYDWLLDFHVIRESLIKRERERDRETDRQIGGRGSFISGSRILFNSQHLKWADVFCSRKSIISTQSKIGRLIDWLKQRVYQVILFLEFWELRVYLVILFLEFWELRVYLVILFLEFWELRVYLVILFLEFWELRVYLVILFLEFWELRDYLVILFLEFWELRVYLVILFLEI